LVSGIICRQDTPVY